MLYQLFLDILKWIFIAYIGGVVAALVIALADLIFSWRNSHSDRRFYRLQGRIAIAIASIISAAAAVEFYLTYISIDRPPSPTYTAAQLKICDDLARSASWYGFVDGQVAYDAPLRMYLGDETTVEVVLGVHCPQEILIQRLAELRSTVVGQAPRQQDLETLDVGPVMTATLSGTGFMVDPEGPRSQAIRPRRITEWLWAVTATHPGPRHLILELNASANGLPAPVTAQKVFLIQVDVLPTQQETTPAQAETLPGSLSPDNNTNATAWEAIKMTAIFAFGVIFISVILFLAFYRRHPTPFEYTVSRIVLALSAAAVATLLTGFLDVEISGFLKAGGALAVFAIVYFKIPAALGVQSGNTGTSDGPPENHAGTGHAP